MTREVNQIAALGDLFEGVRAVERGVLPAAFERALGVAERLCAGYPEWPMSPWLAAREVLRLGGFGVEQAIMDRMERLAGAPGARSAVIVGLLGDYVPPAIPRGDAVDDPGLISAVQYGLLTEAEFDGLVRTQRIYDWPPRIVSVPRGSAEAIYALEVGEGGPSLVRVFRELTDLARLLRSTGVWDSPSSSLG